MPVNATPKPSSGEVLKFAYCSLNSADNLLADRLIRQPYVCMYVQLGRFCFPYLSFLMRSLAAIAPVQLLSSAISVPRAGSSLTWALPSRSGDHSRLQSGSSKPAMMLANQRRHEMISDENTRKMNRAKEKNRARKLAPPLSRPSPCRRTYINSQLSGLRFRV